MMMKMDTFQTSKYNSPDSTLVIQFLFINLAFFMFQKSDLILDSWLVLSVVNGTFCGWLTGIMKLRQRDRFYWDIFNWCWHRITWKIDRKWCLITRKMVKIIIWMYIKNINNIIAILNSIPQSLYLSNKHYKCVTIWTSNYRNI